MPSIVRIVLSAAFSLLAFTMSSVGQAQTSMTSSCRPAQQLGAFRVGSELVQSVDEMKISMNQNGGTLEVHFTVAAGTSPGETAQKVETYSLAGARSGSLVEWAADPTGLGFQYVLTHQTQLDVETAGPVPGGTFDSRYNLVLIGLYATSHPETSVQKIEMVCRETYVY